METKFFNNLPKKPCRKCHVVKVKELFRRCAGYSDGYRTDCKECEYKQNQAYKKRKRLERRAARQEVKRVAKKNNAVVRREVSRDTSWYKAACNMTCDGKCGLSYAACILKHNPGLTLEKDTQSLQKLEKRFDSWLQRAKVIVPRNGYSFNQF